MSGAKLDVEVGDVVAGRYAIEAAIGEGGYGAVYVARHLTNGARVALKLLHVRHSAKDKEVNASSARPNTSRASTTRTSSRSRAERRTPSPRHAPLARSQTLTRRASTDERGAMSIESFRETIPTAAWRVRVRAGELDRTLKQVQAVERELVKFLGALAKAKGDEHATQAVQSVVLALNAVGGLDGRLGNILETDEREVLVPWILGAARAAGMRRKDDITEQWRDW